MKNNFNKKRGSILEKTFDKYIENWNRMGLHAVRNEVRTKFFNGKMIYVKKQTCDYSITLPIGQQNWLLDSKECANEKFYPSQQAEHQIEDMKKFQSMGHRAGFVVHFYLEDPIGINMRFIEDFDKPASIESGTKFDWLDIVPKNNSSLIKRVTENIEGNYLGY